MDMITRLTQWLTQWHGWDKIRKSQADGLPETPFSVSIRPCGVCELERRCSILGDVIMRIRYSFLVEIRLEKSYGDEQTALENAEWMLQLQYWINQQGMGAAAPRFGAGEQKEVIKAENGTMTTVDREGMAMYQLQITVECNQEYREEQYE